MNRTSLLEPVQASISHAFLETSHSSGEQSAVAAGARQESLALEWLLAQPGWILLERNYRRKTGELDAILEHAVSLGDRLDLVFVEIRTRRRARTPRSKSGRATALESITPAKQRRLRQTIAQYLVRYRGKAQRCRVDLVLKDDDGAWIRLENALLQ